MAEKKEVSPMEVIAGNIASQEQQLQEQIFRLDQLYYQQHKDSTDESEEYANLIHLITQADQNRKALYQKKLHLEGKEMCMNCGSIIPYGSAFCCSCGKSIEKKEQESILGSVCSNCGKINHAGSGFCSGCGAKLEN